MTLKSREYLHKSFYLKPQDQEMLIYLAGVYKMNPSAVIRHLITEQYAILKYVEQKKP